MAKGKRIKQEAAAFPIPQSRDQVVEAIAEIGRRQRDRELSKGVQAWCEAHRLELTQDGKIKHASLASGEVKWRMRPPSVVIRGKDAVIELLKKLKLDRFVRQREEVNKEAILLEPEAVKSVPGISITQSEDFVIVPFETELEEVA